MMIEISLCSKGCLKMRNFRQADTTTQNIIKTLVDISYLFCSLITSHLSNQQSSFYTDLEHPIALDIHPCYY